jgi:chemotaxis protein histidine kinase CheA
MGAVVSLIIPLVALIMGLVNSLRTDHVHENPTFANMDASEAAKQARAQAEAAQAEAEAAREQAEAMRAEAEAVREAAQAAERQAEETLQRERAAYAEALREVRENEARAKAERAASEQSRAQAEEAGRVARAEMDRIREVLAESQKVEEDAKERARQAQRQAEEDRRNAREAQEAAEVAAREANERARAAKQAQKEAEEHLKKGVQPVVVPSHEEVEAAKRRVQYTEGLFHFAVAGVAGGGKSSLINAFRGLRNRDTAFGAAPTGVTETTLVISRLPDPNKENPFVWYDIPGAGTMKIKDWQYFNEQGLYVFDCIIVVFDSRFTMTDIATLVNCKRFGIPTYIVRSKSDAHIRSIMRERGYDSDDDDGDRTLRKTLYTEAREQYIAETRANIKQNLEDANLPDQRVYMVSNSVLLSIVKNQNVPPKFIDELELMRDLFSTAHSRRCVPRRSLR